jgi:hypothetical protein
MQDTYINEPGKNEARVHVDESSAAVVATILIVVFALIAFGYAWFHSATTPGIPNTGTSTPTQQVETQSSGEPGTLTGDMQ